MKQQPEYRKEADRRIRGSWAVTPATRHDGAGALIAVRLGTLECYIPETMATHLADALIDCVETGTPYEHHNPRRRPSRRKRTNTTESTT